MPSESNTGDTLIPSQPTIPAVGDTTLNSRDSSFVAPAPFGVWPDLRLLESEKASFHLTTLKEHCHPLSFFGKKSIRAESPPNYIKGRFGFHLLKPINHSPKPRIPPTNSLEAGIVLAALFLVALLRLNYTKRLKAFWDAFWIKRFGIQLMREENVQSQRTSWFLILVFLLSASSFLYAALPPFRISFLPDGIPFQFLVFFVFILCVYAVKWLVYKLTGLILNTTREADEYLFLVFLTNQIAGIFFLILVIVLEFQRIVPREYIITAGIFLALGLFFFRTVRGINLAMGSPRVKGVYIFLYFCTLEIIPMVWLVKMLDNLGIIFL